MAACMMTMPGIRWHTVRRPVWYAALVLSFAAFAFFHWVMWPVHISGESMVPTYSDGQPTFINKLAYVTRPPQRGDVVGVQTSGECLLKRVIGLPGEKIEFKRGTVVVNGRPLDEPYIVRPLLWWLPPVQLGPDDYWVMGDNRTASVLGAVSKQAIIGKAVY